MRVPDGRASKSLEFVFTTIYVINTLVSSYAFELRVRHGSRLYSMPGYLPPLATCTLPFGMFHLLTYGHRSLGLTCKLLFVLPYAPLYAVRVPANPACCTCARSPMLIYAPCAPVCPIVCVPADPAAPRARDLHASPACPTQSAHSYPMPYTGTQLRCTYPRQLPPTPTAAHFRSFTLCSLRFLCSLVLLELICVSSPTLRLHEACTLARFPAFPPQSAHS